MEAVGIASSITALAGAAVAAFRASESMYNIARRVRHVRDEIEMFAMEIETFANLLKTAQFALDRRIKALDIQSPALGYLQDKEVLVQLNKYSRRVTHQVKKLKGPILSIESSIPFITRFKWMLKKRTIDSSTSMMLRVESKLNIVLNVLSLESAYQRGDRDEIKELKRQINVHLRAIEILQERQERQSMESDDSREPIEPPSLTDNIQDVVVELGRNMVDRGIVPTTDSRRHHGQRSESPSTQSTNHSYEEASISANSTNSSGNVQVVAEELRRNMVDQGIVPTTDSRRHHGRRSESRSTQSTNHSHDEVSISANGTNFNHQHQLRHTGSLIQRGNSPLQSDRVDELFEVSRAASLESRLDIRQSQTSSVLVEIREDRSAESDNENDTASISYTDTDPGTDSDGEIIPKTTPASRGESEFILVHPNRYLLDLNSNHAIESVSGYVILEHGRKVLQTALLDHVLPQNIISLAHAKELGCTFEPQVDERTISIDFGNGERKRSLGQVILQWGQGIHLHRATFPVRCFVYDCHIKNLIFGKEFSKEASYIWPGADDSSESGK